MEITDISREVSIFSSDIAYPRRLVSRWFKMANRDVSQEAVSSLLNEAIRLLSDGTPAGNNQQQHDRSHSQRVADNFR